MLVDSVGLIVVFFQIPVKVFEKPICDRVGVESLLRERVHGLLDHLSNLLWTCGYSLVVLKGQRDIDLDLHFEEHALGNLHELLCPFHVLGCAGGKEVVSSEPLPEHFRDVLRRVVRVVSVPHSQLGKEAFLPIDESHLSVLVSEE